MGDVRRHRESEIFRKFEELARENDVQRLDEDFLRRFLVGHQYDLFQALKALKNFESFINRRRHKWLRHRKSRLETILGSQIVDVLDEPGLQEQKVIWIRIEKWDPQQIAVDEILEVAGLLCELVYARTKEIKSIDVIVDLNNFSLKHLYGLSPKFAKRMVFFMSECLPMRLLHVYVVRQPKMFHLVYSLFKPFIEERMRKLITICGHNYELMTATIGRDVLPPELEGTSDSLAYDRWLTVLYTKKTQKELAICGYEFY
ncbi:alpha-tocopherol transfer protein-like [Leptinotarsa decemlineata]|uniref:alpha-tocopherol transfer protein-like n=1 Tax=Leptinotarsa decemlineata TaxID=7539 RepID=UPI003D30AF10